MSCKHFERKYGFRFCAIKGTYVFKDCTSNNGKCPDYREKEVNEIKNKGKEKNK